MRPARRVVRLVKARVLHMSISPTTGAVDLLIRLEQTNLDCRNAIHQAMRHAADLALAYERAEEGPVYEAVTDADSCNRSGA